ncbi:thap domain protein [Anaeramoeba flamelloides]|uniref:Thap domain protein n=1 Tax=Anaeramoeba flamelloides TaxID=1746091 RepID=A0ABQ8Z921_9EUKA|nr:thap domain protein [Anaeramoeba flamelloides]
MNYQENKKKKPIYGLLLIYVFRKLKNQTYINQVGEQKKMQKKKLQFKKKDNFQKLLDKLEIPISQRDLLNKKEQLLLTLSLYRLALPFRVLGLYFNASSTTAFRISKKITTLIIDQLDDFIRWPNIVERKLILEDWSKQGWSNVIGAIDCTEHARFRDLDNEHLFHSGKQRKSTIMSLAICDTQGILIYFKTGIEGHNNDQGTFNKSDLTEILVKNEKLLGDGGFSGNHFIVPYGKKNKNFNQEKRLFNIFHSQSRVIIENVFAHLKKNKICQILIQHEPEFQSKAIKACALIYNFKILENKLLRQKNWIPKLHKHFEVPTRLKDHKIIKTEFQKSKILKVGERIKPSHYKLFCQKHKIKTHNKKHSQIKRLILDFLQNKIITNNYINTILNSIKVDELIDGNKNEDELLINFEIKNTKINTKKKKSNEMKKQNSICTDELNSNQEIILIGENLEYRLYLLNEDSNNFIHDHKRYLMKPLLYNYQIIEKRNTRLNKYLSGFIWHNNLCYLNSLLHLFYPISDYLKIFCNSTYNIINIFCRCVLLLSEINKNTTLPLSEKIKILDSNRSYLICSSNLLRTNYSRYLDQWNVREELFLHQEFKILNYINNYKCTCGHQFEETIKFPEYLLLKKIRIVKNMIVSDNWKKCPKCNELTLLQHSIKFLSIPNFILISVQDTVYTDLKLNFNLKINEKFYQYLLVGIILYQNDHFITITYDKINGRILWDGIQNIYGLNGYPYQGVPIDQTNHDYVHYQVIHIIYSKNF